MKSSTKKIFKTSLITAAASLLVVVMTAAATGYPVKLNEFLNGLKTKLQAFDTHNPEDRVYVQFDKPFYKPGDDVWMSVMVRDARTMQKSKKSDIVHLELINPKGNVQEKFNLVTKDGIAAGDFHIDAEAAGGIYKVRAYTQWQDNHKQAFKFEKEIQVQAVVLPNLKMKLDFERKAYGPGDHVTVKLDLATNENTALAGHAFDYVASLDGNPIATKSGKTDAAGRAVLQLDLPKDLATTDGLVNVMIAYNGLTESISRSIPITLNKITMALYPEGGDLVTGLASKVAFRALNEFGKPADIEGIVVDQNGTAVGSLSSYHQGMGAFALQPAAGKTYKVKLTRPEGITTTYDVPEALPRGYVMTVEKTTATELVVALQTTETEALNLVAQVRGEIYWASEVSVKPGKTLVNIPLLGFPMGVCQLTLFDARGIERCERLAFVNRDRQLKVALSTDKEKYLPREKVTMTVKVTDERGLPMPANLALSVVNDQLISFADDKSGHILSQLLLEPDLNSKVEEPRFYFDAKEEKSLAALDFLLMTSGWRRFVWEEVTADQLPVLKAQGERALIGGRIIDAYTQQPIPNASLSIPLNNYGGLADPQGKFAIAGIDIGLANTLTVVAEGYTTQNYPLNDYSQSLTVQLYPNTPRYFNEQLGAANMRQENMVMLAAPVQRDAPMAGAVGVVRRDNAKGAAPMKNKAIAPAGKAATKAPIRAVAPVVDVAAAPQEEAAEMEMADDMDMDGIEPQPRDKKTEEKKDARGEKLALEDGDANGLLDLGIVMDERQRRMMAQDSIAAVKKAQPTRYHRARAFAAPVYAAGAKAPAVRSDFRETLYWNPNVKVDRTGKAVLEFFASDEITSFRAIAEGIGYDGTVGRAEMVFFTQLPFSMQARVPVEVAMNDQLIVPVILKNNTDAPIRGSLHVTYPAGLEPQYSPAQTEEIAAGQAKVINLAYKVLQTAGEELFNIAFSSEGHTDAFEQKLKIVPQGFPVALAFSGNAPSQKYEFLVNNSVQGSISATFTAFPNVVTDLVKGIESILQEPYGCFEQTSTSSYPNAMVLSYMKEQETIDPAIVKRASDLLDRGYKRLTSYECAANGYEWFGSNPPHEALTAYGLMQFSDYSKVYDGVDRSMVDRTAKWLLSRRDGKGGFKRDPKALDSFGRADEEITSAYIVYALSEGGYKEVMPEAIAAHERAIANNDPYQLALVANAMFNLGDAARGKSALAALMRTQANDGSFTGKKHSITVSGGHSLTVETTALAVMAMLKSGAPDNKGLTAAVESIVKSRSGAGGFGSTQGTILALKSLVAYSKFAKRTNESGRIEIRVNGKQVAETSYAAGHKDAIELKGLEAYLSEGKNTIEVRYLDCKNPLPYAVAVRYHTSLPASNPACVVDLETKLSATSVKMGETLRLSATLKNKTDQGQPMTMAIIGLPAGLSAQPWQLKELQEKKVVDFYEVIGNNVVCYYRQMTPGETRNINLDLKADIPGRYTAPASSAYLYYTAEHKDWTALPQVQITQ